eukprot:scaffold25487_cov28-Tisochrysis_lutea.AAC.1
MSAERRIVRPERAECRTRRHTRHCTPCRKRWVGGGHASPGARAPASTRSHSCLSSRSGCEW